MKISKIRSFLYGFAKFLGDVSAVSKSAKKSSVSPVAKRLGRRLYGKFASKGFNLFKWFYKMV